MFVLSFATSPVLGWGKGGCFLSDKNKASQDETVEQVDGYDANDM
tara:strand:- start:184 stop:318 length:135 start_codon:yes stop_codon:yes gene_type:complete